MRRVISVLCAVCFIAPLMSTSVGRAQDTEAEKAAKEIADARERANAAADAYFASESRIDELTLQQDQLQSEITALEGDVKALQLAVENVAIGRYTRSGSTGVPLLTGFQSPEDQVKIDALMEVIYDSSANDFDRFDALNADLADKRQKLSDKKDQAQKERANLAVLKDQASAEVQRLKDVEAARLQEEGVQEALIALQAQRKRDKDRKKLLDAPTPTDPTVPTDDPAATPGDAVTDTGSDSGDSGDSGAPVSSGGATRPVLPDAGGGQTGGGGNGSFFAGGGNDYGGPGWVCPTGAAPAPFADTWGAPRSGGRRHQGVDMIGTAWNPGPRCRRRRGGTENQRARRHDDLVHRHRWQQLLLRPPRRLCPARRGQSRYGDRDARPDRQRAVQHRPPPLRDSSRWWSGGQPVPDGRGTLPVVRLIATG